MSFTKGSKHTEESKQKMSKARKGSKSYNYKGGKCKTSSGYISVLCPNHPLHDHNDCVLEHRLVMEKELGRYLTPEEITHHINGIKTDNRIENLLLFTNQGEHMRFHRKIKRNGNTKVIIMDGKEMTLPEISEKFNVNYTTLWKRHKRGLRGIDLIKSINYQNGRAIKERGQR